MTKPADDKLGHAKREIKALTGQLAETRARMSMLESFIEGVEKNAEQFNPEWNFVCSQALAGGSKAWLLRQKAAAVDAAANECMPGPYGQPDDPAPEYMAACESIADVKDYAKRLRQAADEADKEQES
jgi:hypothetical protein